MCKKKAIVVFFLGSSVVGEPHHTFQMFFLYSLVTVAEVLPSVGKFMKHLFKLSCWALQSSPLRYQCEKTKLSESVARPALANQIEDEKWRHFPSPLDTYLLYEYFFHLTVIFLLESDPNAIYVSLYSDSVIYDIWTALSATLCWMFIRNCWWWSSKHS